MSDWLALDIGGANLKAAHTSGTSRSVPFALWKHPHDLAPALASLADLMPTTDRVAVTMTGELCDCFETKAQGVKEILDATSDVFRGHILRVWTTRGRLILVEEALSQPLSVAAGNWLALATVAAKLGGEGLLLDVGSTTADLIPFRDRAPVPVGRTDTERLRSGELVYAGVKRTPLCALATSLPHRGELTGLAAELFATTRDVYLTLGDLEDDPDDRDTADGRAATSAYARDRLARMIAADRGTFSPDDALALAREADSVLRARLTDAAHRVIARSLNGAARCAVVSGSGEFLAERIARAVLPEGTPILLLSELWGPAASDGACAYALAMLASERDGESE